MRSEREFKHFRHILKISLLMQCLIFVSLECAAISFFTDTEEDSEHEKVLAPLVATDSSSTIPDSEVETNANEQQPEIHTTIEDVAQMPGTLRGDPLTNKFKEYTVIPLPPPSTSSTHNSK